MGFQERLLDEVGRVALAPQPPAEPKPCQERQIAPVQFQELSERSTVLGTGLLQELSRGSIRLVAHFGYLSE